MKEKNYSKQILEFLAITLTGTTSKVIAKYIEKDEAFTRVYLSRLVRRNKVRVMGKFGKFNIYHIDSRTFFEFRIEVLERENKQLKDELDVAYLVINNQGNKIIEIKKRLNNI